LPHEERPEFSNNATRLGIWDTCVQCFRFGPIDPHRVAIGFINAARQESRLARAQEIRLKTKPPFGAAVRAGQHRTGSPHEIRRPSAEQGNFADRKKQWR